MEPRRLPVVLVAGAAVVAAVWMRRRPVKQPAHHGAWKPRET